MCSIVWRNRHKRRSVSNATFSNPPWMWYVQTVHFGWEHSSRSLFGSYFSFIAKDIERKKKKERREVDQLLCSKAMEFSPFWHPPQSDLSCLRNCIKITPAQTIPQQLISSSVFFHCTPTFFPHPRCILLFCALACVRARARACVCVVCEECIMLKYIILDVLCVHL